MNILCITKSICYVNLKYSRFIFEAIGNKKEQYTIAFHS